ncbi:hypothetical protein V2G26_013406 [Clonostachys chloroleuca]
MTCTSLEAAVRQCLTSCRSDRGHPHRALPYLQQFTTELHLVYSSWHFDIASKSWPGKSHLPSGRNSIILAYTTIHLAGASSMYIKVGQTKI